LRISESHKVNDKLIRELSLPRACMKIFLIWSLAAFPVTVFATAQIVCTGDVEIIQQTQATKGVRSMVAPRKDSAEISILNKNKKVLMKIYPWLGVRGKKLFTPSNTQLKIASDNYFEALIIDEKKTIACDVQYE
jgi:hypothetical protein